jgi:hypothetical protein
MRKECRHCRTVSQAPAPYCEACGCDFDPEPVQAAPRIQWFGKPASWKGRLIAIGSGLLVAIVIQLIRSY